MRKLTPALALALALVPALAHAQRPCNLGQGASELCAIQQQLGGLLFSTTATAATATGTSEQTLGTYSLPANTLDQPGHRLIIEAMFTFAANTHNRTPKLYFGSESISAGADAVSGGSAYLVMEVVKTGPKTQITWGRGATETAPVVPVAQAGAEDDTAGITIKATCTDGTSAANDCVLQDMYVRHLD